MNTIDHIKLFMCLHVFAHEIKKEMEKYLYIATKIEMFLYMMLKRILVLLLGGVIILVGCATTQRRMQKIQSEHPQWDRATVEKLAAWQIEPRMTREMVQAALGKPDTVSREDGKDVWGYAVWVVTIWYHYQRIAYLVYFDGDRVVETRGNVNAIQTLN